MYNISMQVIMRWCHYRRLIIVISRFLITIAKYFLLNLHLTLEQNGIQPAIVSFCNESERYYIEAYF